MSFLYSDQSLWSCKIWKSVYENMFWKKDTFKNDFHIWHSKFKDCTWQKYWNSFQMHFQKVWNIYTRILKLVEIQSKIFFFLANMNFWHWSFFFCNCCQKTKSVIKAFTRLLPTIQTFSHSNAFENKFACIQNTVLNMNRSLYFTVWMNCVNNMHFKKKKVLQN